MFGFILYNMQSAITKKEVIFPVGTVELKGDLSIPNKAKALVIFAHGSGSSRLSPRNQMVADYLNANGIATFLFDLLTPVEDRDYSNRFNISLLADRLEKASRWLMQQAECRGLSIGYFGASTGAAAALIAAANLPEVSGVVSRGGRPDLALEFLPQVKAPTLLIVGSFDVDVLRLNAQAFKLLNCEKKLEVIQGATHLFEEAGAMERVCEIATHWFQLHLQRLEFYR